ncbi:MAG: AsmA family protein, partial [Pseudomonadota bacterium]
MIAILILVPLAAAAVFVARFDPNAYKPEIAAAIEKATGRSLSLNGPLSLGISLLPTISAANVALANPPGFSRPEMATLARLDARVALLPLLSGRIEIRRLVLVRPDIAIEIDGAGQSNLSFAPVGPVAAHAAPGLAEPAPAAAGAVKPVAIDIQAIGIQNGKLSWQDDRSGRHGVLVLRSFSAASEAAGGPLAIAADGDYGGIHFTLEGTAGPLSRLTTSDTATPWPVQLAVVAGSARVSVAGSLTNPTAGRGYQLELNATLPTLEQLAPLLPGAKLPALHGIVVSAHLADAGNGLPQVS